MPKTSINNDLSGLSPQQRDLVRRAVTPGRAEMIMALLKTVGLTVPAFARKRGFPQSSVYSCIRGERPMPVVRAALAGELDLPESFLFPACSEPGPDRDAA